jgi:hypothetical protein
MSPMIVFFVGLSMLASGMAGFLALMFAAEQDSSGEEHLKVAMLLMAVVMIAVCLMLGAFGYVAITAMMRGGANV